MAANSCPTPDSRTSLCGHSVCAWAPLQCRHLCFAACFPQYTTLWWALISCYTLGAIVPFCCKLIHVPLTLFSAHFNTRTELETGFLGTCLTMFSINRFGSHTLPAAEVVAGPCMRPCIKMAGRGRILWCSITQFMYTDGFWADCGQPEMKAAADVLIWWLLPWQQDGDWGGAERVNRKLSLSHTNAYPSLTLAYSLSSTVAHKHTTPPEPHQPAHGPRRSSFGSVSCKGPSLGQQGGVRLSDSLSGRQASVANYETVIKEREHHGTALLLRGTCWSHPSSSASAQRPNRRFNKSSFQL